MTCVKYYFTNKVVNAWNSLPDHVVLSDTINQSIYLNQENPQNNKNSNTFISRLGKFWQHLHCAPLMHAYSIVLFLLSLSRLLCVIIVCHIYVYPNCQHGWPALDGHLASLAARMCIDGTFSILSMFCQLMTNECSLSQQRQRKSICRYPTFQD